MYGCGGDRRALMCRTTDGQEVEQDRRSHGGEDLTGVMSDGQVTLIITAEMFSDQRTDEYEDYAEGTNDYVQCTNQYAQSTSEYASRIDKYVQRTNPYAEEPSDYINPSRLSSPTCEDLGIPRDGCVPARSCIRNPALHIDGMRYGPVCKNDPFSPLSMIPLPSVIGIGVIEPTFVRKRNERERFRVRCVNDGFSRLKEHLPLHNKAKRISKVETLRTAIRYIKHLQTLLGQNDDGVSEINTKYDFSDHSVNTRDSSDTSEYSDFSDHGVNKRELGDISGSDSDDSVHGFKRVKSELHSESSSDEDIYDAT